MPCSIEKDVADQTHYLTKEQDRILTPGQPTLPLNLPLQMTGRVNNKVPAVRAARTPLVSNCAI